MFKNENILPEFRYITYLIGAMEKPVEGDGGGSKRKEIEKELLIRGVYPINPVTLEKSKTGMSVEKAKTQMDTWLKENDISRFKENSIKIWKGIDVLCKNGELKHIPGDLDYVKMSNFLTCMYSEGDKPCGTYGETFIAFDRNIPVYLITPVDTLKLPKSFLQAIYGGGGAVFKDIGHYLNFLENTYNLCRKE